MQKLLIYTYLKLLDCMPKSTVQFTANVTYLSIIARRSFMLVELVFKLNLDIFQIS
jgi:hypothetical protein